LTKLWGAVAVALLCSGCASAVPTMRTMPVGDDIYLYFIPPSTWSVTEAKNILSLDITYRSEKDTPAVCNISFFDTEKIPGEVTAIAFTNGSTVYPLHGVKTMFVSQDKNELRITSSIPIEELRKALEAQTIYLQFTLDGIRYTAAAPKLFLINKEQFLSLIQSHFYRNVQYQSTL
jgi:hypothetical protein